MKRRSFRRLRIEPSAPVSPAVIPGPARRRAPAGPPAPDDHHHHVYVVLLDSQVRQFRKIQKENPARNPAKPCLYVGMTGLPPEERFRNHKEGIKASRLVRDYGVGLMPELFEHLNPMPYEAAAAMERDLAEDLRRQGYTVTGGH